MGRRGFTGSSILTGFVSTVAGGSATQFQVDPLLITIGPGLDTSYSIKISNGNGQIRVNTPVFAGAGFYITNSTNGGDAFYFLPVWNGASLMTFGISVTSATINQVDATVNAAAAATMTVRAQNGTGTGAADGGLLNVGGGTSVNGTYGGTKVTSPLNLGYFTSAPAAGSQTLTAAQSANNVFIFTGTNVATVLLTRRVVETTCVFVRNNTNQTLTFGFLTGGTVSLVLNSSAYIISDGTNAVKLVTGT